MERNNNKIKILSAAFELRGVLSTIENLLKDYNVDGNGNYCSYCLSRAEKAKEDYQVLDGMYEDTYRVPFEKRKEIDVVALQNILVKYYRLLDDIDTASDIFKPKWCKITSAVAELQNLRFLYCSVAGRNTDESGLMATNGSCVEEKVTIVI